MSGLSLASSLAKERKSSLRTRMSFCSSLSIPAEGTLYPGALPAAVFIFMLMPAAISFTSLTCVSLHISSCRNARRAAWGGFHGVCPHPPICAASGTFPMRASLRAP